MSEQLFILKDHVWAKTNRTMELRKQGFNDLHICRGCGLIRETNRSTFRKQYFRKERIHFADEHLPLEACVVGIEFIKKMTERGQPVRVAYELCEIESFDKVAEFEETNGKTGWMGAERLYCVRKWNEVAVKEVGQ